MIPIKSMKDKYKEIELYIETPHENIDNMHRNISSHVSATIRYVDYLFYTLMCVR